MPSTIEETVRLVADTARGRGVTGARGEPSHIHLPRRRRLARPDDRAGSIMSAVSDGDLAQHDLAEPAAEEE